MRHRERPQLDIATVLGREKGLFDAVFDLATVGIAQVGLDGRWLLFNRKVNEILGYTPEELQARSLSMVTHPDDLSVDLGILRRLVSGEISTCSKEQRLVHKSGALRWVNLTITLVRDQQGDAACLIAVLEDIGERKEVQDELRQSEEKFYRIFALAPIAITITTLEEGRFVEFNDAAERLSGYRRDEVIGRSVEELGVWREPGDRAALVREVLEHGEVRDREMVMRQKNGRAFWGLFTAVMVEIHGVKHLLSLVADIGERKKAQEALRESEERFRLLADHAPVLIWEAGADSRCTFFNETWLKYTGRTLQQELGDGWAEGVHPEDRDYCLATYHGCFEKREPFSIEYRLRRSDGSYGWVVDNGVPRVSAGGELLGYLGTAWDVSDQKQAKEELQEANRLLAQRVAERTAELTETIRKLKEEMQERVRIGHALHDETAERLHMEAELREKELMLLHQGRLAAMGEMIGNIAHQWRQPLNLLGLVAQDLAMTCKRGELSSEYLDRNVKKILETIRHMSRTIDDFRDFFRPSRERVPFRVLESVQKTISLLEGTLKALEITTTVQATGDPVVQGFPNELSQVLLNIMVNSRDAFAANPVPHPAISVEVGLSDGRCVITITDNAGGIPVEILDRIFDPYFTTKGPEEGTGVGLFMSKTIIEKNMGGTLTASNVEGGARFRVVI